MDDALVLLAALLLSSSQLLQKIGADRRLRRAYTVREWLVALGSRELLLAALLLCAGTALWLCVLYRMEVSRAFPFLSLGTVLVVAMSRMLLKEDVSRCRWTGVALISIGIAMVAGT